MTGLKKKQDFVMLGRELFMLYVNCSLYRVLLACHDIVLNLYCVKLESFINNIERFGWTHLYINNSKMWTKMLLGSYGTSMKRCDGVYGHLIPYGDL